MWPDPPGQSLQLMGLSRECFPVCHRDNQSHLAHPPLGIMVWTECEDLGSYLQGGRTTSLAASAGSQQWAFRWAEQWGSSGHEVQGRGQRHRGDGTSKSLPRIVEPLGKSASRGGGPSGYRLGAPSLEQPFWGITTVGVSQGVGTPRETRDRGGGRCSGFRVSQIWVPV